MELYHLIKCCSKMLPRAASYIAIYSRELNIGELYVGTHRLYLNFHLLPQVTFPLLSGKSIAPRNRGDSFDSCRRT